MKYDLSNKTIFDFTKDNKLISKITGLDASDVECVSTYKKTAHQLNIAAHIIQYADHSGNKELYDDAVSYFKRKKQSYDDKVSHYGNKNIIVD